MAIAAIDHWVLVVKDLEATFAFYRMLGLEAGWQERPGGRGKRPIIRISETQKLINSLKEALVSGDKDLILKRVDEVNDYTRPFAERLMDQAISTAMKGKSIE